MRNLAFMPDLLTGQNGNRPWAKLLKADDKVKIRIVTPFGQVGAVVLEIDHLHRPWQM